MYVKKGKRCQFFLSFLKCWGHAFVFHRKPYSFDLMSRFSKKLETAANKFLQTDQWDTQMILSFKCQSE